MSVQARVRCRALGDRVGVGVECPDPISESMAHHSYTTETVLRSSVDTRTWWYGGGGDLTEEPIGDDPPFGGEAWVPAWSGSAELTFTIRLHAFWDDETSGDEQEATWWWSGTVKVEVSSGSESLRFTLDECEPRTGAPFGVAETSELEVAVGPTLLPLEEGAIVDIVNKAGAVLPGVGVFRPFANALLTPEGTTQLPSFQPEGDCYLERSFGGPQGALVIVWNHRRGLAGGMQMTLVRVPDGEPRTTKIFEGYCTVYGAVWNAEGDRLGAAIFGKGGMRVYVIDADGQIESEVHAGRSERDDDFGVAIDLEWSGAELIATRAGSSHTHLRSAPRAVSPGWRQYGAGSPCSRMLADGRMCTAWMLCAEFRGPGRPEGTTIIAWLNDDETHGQVVVPDHGWAQDDYRFGKLAILDDGRIVAIGTKIWLVDPRTSKVVSLGAAGDYPPHLPIHERRLYNRGPGPWWTHLPS